MKLKLSSGRIIDCKNEIEELVIEGEIVEYKNQLIYDALFKTRKNIKVILKDKTIIKGNQIRDCLF